MCKSRVECDGQVVVMFEMCPTCQKVREMGALYALFIPLDLFMSEVGQRVYFERYNNCPEHQENFLRESHGGSQCGQT